MSKKEQQKKSGKTGKLIKVKVTQMYYDGVRRHREGSIITIDEGMFAESCMEVVSAKSGSPASSSKAKSMKSKPEESAYADEEVFEDEDQQSSPDDDVLV